MCIVFKNIFSLSLDFNHTNKSVTNYFTCTIYGFRDEPAVLDKAMTKYHGLFLRNTEYVSIQIGKNTDLSVYVT